MAAARGPRDAGELAIAVVVATRERPDRLERLLAALAAQTLAPERFEVIVVDDGSDAATTEVLLDRGRADGGMRMQALEGSGDGPAAARNAGWRRASAPLVAFTDDDCEPDPGWLEALLRAAAERPGGVVQGRTAPLPEEAASTRGPVRTQRIEELGPWYQTCNILYPTALLERLGGFDERFRRPFGEDVDLAWRAIGDGADVAFAPDALVHHAVEPLGVGGLLRTAMRDPDEALAFKLHPSLRRRVRRLGLFKNDHHAFLVLAAAAVVSSRRTPLALAAAIPYGLVLAARCRSGRLPPSWAPLLVLFDAIELAQSVRGAVRHRVAIV
jgi:glycosyltransferase involved in cell wall biosynthesis